MTTAHPGPWHVDRDVLSSWVDGSANLAVSVSIEHHLVACDECRATIGGLVDPTPLSVTWDNLLTAIEVPAPNRLARMAARLGLGPSDAVLVASAATMRLAWMAGVITVLTFSVIASTFASDGGVGLFLAAAPLLPVAGVAATFGPANDPAYEAVAVTPYSMLRLVMLRTLIVLATTVPFTVAAGLLLPITSAIAVAWLLPAACFVAVVLTAGAWFDPDRVAWAVGCTWVVVVAVAVRNGGPLILFSPVAVVIYLALASAGTALFARRVLSDGLLHRLP